MKNPDPSAHPYLRLVYSRPEPGPIPATPTVIMAVPEPEPSISGEWRYGTLDDFCDDILRVVKEAVDAMPEA
jgi:hypothetical protein